MATIRFAHVPVWQTLVTLAALASAPSTAPAQQPETELSSIERSALGCYDLELRQGPPLRIRLDTIVVRTLPRIPPLVVRQVTVFSDSGSLAANSAEWGRRYSYSGALYSDSLFVAWPHYSMFTLAVHSDSLVGSLEISGGGDVVMTQPGARARRRACP